jgi:hypothetical protein
VLTIGITDRAADGDTRTTVSTDTHWLTGRAYHESVTKVLWASIFETPDESEWSTTTAATLKNVGANFILVIGFSRHFKSPFGCSKYSIHRVESQVTLQLFMNMKRPLSGSLDNFD